MKMERPFVDDDYDSPSGKLHTCSCCGKQGIWEPPWQWYGSYRDLDEHDSREAPIYKACSQSCMDRREEVEAKKRTNRCRY
jgi:hypothetical protein